MEEYTLKEKEYHPSADSAMEWFRNYQINHLKDWLMLKEAIFSTALSGNRLSEILSSTINRLENHQPVSDRYLLGLVWFIRDSLEKDKIEKFLKD